MKKTMLFLALLAGCSIESSQTSAQSKDDASAERELLNGVRTYLGPKYSRAGVYRGGAKAFFEFSGPAYCPNMNIYPGAFSPGDITDAVTAAVSMYSGDLGAGGSECLNRHEEMEDQRTPAEWRAYNERSPNFMEYYFHITNDEASFTELAAGMRKLGRGFITYVHPKERCLIRLRVNEQRRILSVKVVMREMGARSFSLEEKYGVACVWRALLAGNGLMGVLDMPVDSLNWDILRFGDPTISNQLMIRLYLNTPIPSGTPLDKAMRLMAARTDLKKFYPTDVPVPKKPVRRKDLPPLIAIDPRR